jgi:hypothetical protein
MRIAPKFRIACVRRLSAFTSIALLAAVAAIAAGCGEGEAASGAAVSVYVAAPLCREAQRELTGSVEEAGGLKVRAVCLTATAVEGGSDLATAGSDARRATEDSASVAVLEAPGPTARFSRSIVESAHIAWIETSSGADAMRRVVRALADRGSSSPRSAVLDQVG